jgi:hypothetical protein
MGCVRWSRRAGLAARRPQAIRPSRGVAFGERARRHVPDFSEAGFAGQRQPLAIAGAVTKKRGRQDRRRGGTRIVPASLILHCKARPRDVKGRYVGARVSASWASRLRILSTTARIAPPAAASRAARGKRAHFTAASKSSTSNHRRTPCPAVPVRTARRKARDTRGRVRWFGLGGCGAACQHATNLKSQRRPAHGARLCAAGTCVSTLCIRSA